MGDRRTPLKILQGEAIVAAWNHNVQPGSPVNLIDDMGDTCETKTRSEAWTLGDGTPVVSVDGRTGGFLLERIIPMRSEP